MNCQKINEIFNPFWMIFLNDLYEYYFFSFIVNDHMKEKKLILKIHDKNVPSKITIYVRKT
jgi:hypothetical protein